jgi:hypothetical protein
MLGKKLYIIIKWTCQNNSCSKRHKSHARHEQKPARVQTHLCYYLINLSHIIATMSQLASPCLSVPLSACNIREKLAGILLN